MSVTIGSNLRTGELKFCCDHKCKLDDVAKTATPIGGAGADVICQKCMSGIQEVLSEIISDKITENKKKIKNEEKKEEENERDSTIKVVIISKE